MNKLLAISLITLTSLPIWSMNGLEKNLETSRCNKDEIKGYNEALKKVLTRGNNYFTIDGVAELYRSLKVPNKRIDPMIKVDFKTGFRSGRGSDAIIPNQQHQMPEALARYYDGIMAPYWGIEKSIYDAIGKISDKDFARFNYYIFVGTPADKIVDELNLLFATIAFLEQLPVRPNHYGLASYIYRRIAAIHPFPAGNGRIAELMANHYLARHGQKPFALPPSKHPEYKGFINALRHAMLGDLARKLYSKYQAPSSAEALIEQADECNRNLKTWFKNELPGGWEHEFSGKTYLRSFQSFIR